MKSMQWFFSIYLLEILYIIYNIIYKKKLLMRLDHEVGSYEHATMWEIVNNNYVSLDYKKCISFTIVRSPYSRLVSLYNYQNQS